MGCDSVGFVMISTQYCHHRGSFLYFPFLCVVAFLAQSGFLQIHRVAMVIFVSHPDIKSKGRKKFPPCPFLCLGQVSYFRKEDTFSKSFQENSLHISLSRIDDLSSPKPITGIRAKSTIIDLETNHLGWNGCWKVKHHDKYRFKRNTSKLFTAYLSNIPTLPLMVKCHCMTSATLETPNPIKIRYSISFPCSCNISGSQKETLKCFSKMVALLHQCLKPLVKRISSGLSESP